jgi:hypothetical protein
MIEKSSEDRVQGMATVPARRHPRTQAKALPKLAAGTKRDEASKLSGLPIALQLSRLPPFLATRNAYAAFRASSA